MAGEQRDRILASARKLLSRDGGAATVDDIASAAGVSRATFYRLIGTRSDLFAELGLEPDPGARERILDAAGDMVGHGGLGNLSMDELATAAGISRASLYRLFPGKAALFRDLVQAFSPVEAIISAVEAHREDPPEMVMPALARAVYEAVSRNRGLMLTLFVEVNRLEPDTREAARYLFGRLFGTVVPYVLAQMAAGRLRRMHPAVAMLSFAGPVFLYSLAQPLLARSLPIELPAADDAIGQLADNWLRAMRPDA
jgi:AcrR family transcriptional regulator